MSAVDPTFVAQATYDLRLRTGSPAIGKGVAQGSIVLAIPVFECVDPLSAGRVGDDPARSCEPSSALLGSGRTLEEVRHVVV